MTCVGCGAIIVISADRDPVTTRIHGDGNAKIVTGCFPIDVTTELGPRTGCVLIDAHVTCVSSSAIIVISSDRDPITTRIHGDGNARIVTGCFAIDVTTELGPRTGCVLVDAHVTCVSSSTIVYISTDRDPITTRVHGYGKTRSIIRCFPIDVCAKL